MLTNITLRVYSIIIGFFIVGVITNKFSLESFGQFGMLLVYAHLIKNISLLGVNKGVLYFDENKYDLNSHAIIKILILITSIIIGISSALLFNSIVNYGVLFIVIVLELIYIQIVTSFFLVSESKKKYGFVNYAIEPSIFFCILLFSSYETTKLEWISAISFGGTSIIMTVLYFMESWKRKNLWHLKGVFSAYIELYRNAFTFLIIDIMQYVTTEIDKYYVFSLLSAKDLGIYLVIDKISRSSSIILNTIAPLVHKKFSKIRNNIQLSESVFNDLRSLVVYASSLISFLILLFSVNIVDLFNVSNVYYLLIVMLVARMIQYGSGFSAVLLQMSSLKHYDILSNLIKTIWLVVGSYLFIEYLDQGLYGMVYTVLLSIIATGLIQIKFINKIYKIHYFESIIYLYVPLFIFVSILKYQNGWMEVIANTVIIGLAAYLMNKSIRIYRSIELYSE
jgi:O-antigen/teichoic acid export membrane protein